MLRSIPDTSRMSSVRMLVLQVDTKDTNIVDRIRKGVPGGRSGRELVKTHKRKTVGSYNSSSVSEESRDDMLSTEESISYKCPEQPENKEPSWKDKYRQINQKSISSKGQDAEWTSPSNTSGRDQSPVVGHVRMFHSTAQRGYDSSTADPSFVCTFCHEPPHRHGLGDLFGPQWLGGRDLWLHADCLLWVPCVLLGVGGQVEGVGEAVEQTRGLVCPGCGRRGASVGCTGHSCGEAVHLRCAGAEGWWLEEETYQARCAHHRED